MKIRPGSWIVFVVVAAGLCAAGSAEAKPGLWLGLGASQQSVSGDLDGKTSHAFANSDQTGVIVPGKLADGSGFALDGGYGINRYLAAEFLFAGTQHKATTSAIGPPALDSTGSVSTGLVGLRGTYPAWDDKLELFARGMFGVYSAAYDDYALKGAINRGTFVYTSTDRVVFSGSGAGLGIGAELLLGNFGISLGYTTSSVGFVSASSPGASGRLNKTLNATINTVDLLLTYHFGKKAEEAPADEEPKP